VPSPATVPSAATASWHYHQAEIGPKLGLVSFGPSPQRCWRSQTLPDRSGYLGIPTSTATGFIMVDCWHTHSLPVVLLALGYYWTPTKLELRSSTRSVPTPMLLSAPIFVEGYFTGILSSTPPAQLHLRFSVRACHRWGIIGTHPRKSSTAQWSWAVMASMTYSLRRAFIKSQLW
jgi:hypothetical protein